MAKVRIIGTYQPGRTPLHGVDARAKIGFVLLMTIALLAAHSTLSLAVCTAFFAVALLLSKTKPLQLAAARKPVGIVLALSVLVTMLCPAASADIPIGPLGISGAGIVRGVLVTLRLCLIVGFVLVLDETTTQTQLSDAFVRMLLPLRKVGVNVEDAAVTLSSALRFIPVAVEEHERIAASQAARGACLQDKGIPARASAAFGMLKPLALRVFSNAEAVSQSMLRRGFDGFAASAGKHPMSIPDWLILAAAVAAIVIAIAL